MVVKIEIGLYIDGSDFCPPFDHYLISQTLWRWTTLTIKQLEKKGKVVLNKGIKHVNSCSDVLQVPSEMLTSSWEHGER